MADENGSTFKVPYTKILNITPHSGADRLEIATVYGFQVVVQKGKYQIGSRVVYIPIDSLLPIELEAKLFPADSKIKLHNHRVRQIRIRGLASQGMLMSPKDAEDFTLDEQGHGTILFEPEEDLAEHLGITKYEPPVPKYIQNMGKSKQRHRKQENPLFHQYNGVDNVKWFPDLFQEGEDVVIQEKLHGTNARASILPYAANTMWKRLLKFLKLAPKYEKCYGSNRVEISATTNYKGFYGEDVYGATFNRIDVFSRLKPGETVYGEIIGPGIQKGYSYGLVEHTFVLFDVKTLNADGTQTWMLPDEVQKYANERGFDFVPVLYAGPYHKEYCVQYAAGASDYWPQEKVKEGIVIKGRYKYDFEGNKKALKMMNEVYLDDKHNTDFH